MTVMRRIIVGCDGESSGQDALRLGGALGRLAQADVLAIGVFADLMMPFPRHSDLLEQCELLLRSDRDAFAPEARIRAVGSASPMSALGHAIEHERADLLVLGSARDAEVGRVRAGRHARQLLYGAPCAVALAPVGYAARAGELRRIVVGLDDSPEAADALERGRLLATAAAGRLRVLSAVDPMPPTFGGGSEVVAYLPSDWEQIADVRRRQARAWLDETVQDGAGVESEVVDSEPGVALCEASRSADLLVIGSRRWGPLARLVLGSTAEYVVRHASCPVLVMPRRHDEAPSAAG